MLTVQRTLRWGNARAFGVGPTPKALERIAAYTAISPSFIQSHHVIRCE